MRLRKMMLLVKLSGLVLMAVIIAGLAISWWVSREGFKKNIRAAIAAHTGAEVSIGTLILKLWPWPHCILSDVVLLAPDQWELSVQSVDVFPRLLPLLFGELRPAQVTAVAPAVQLHKAFTKGHDVFDLPPEKQVTSASAMLAQFTGKLAAIPIPADVVMRIAVQNGSLKWLLPELPRVVVLDNLQATFGLNDGKLAADLTAEANFCTGIALRGNFDLKPQTGEARITLTDFKPEAIWPAKWHSAPVQVIETVSRLTLDMALKDSRHLSAECTGAIPRMGLSAHGQDILLSVDEFTAEGRISPDLAELRIPSLQLAQPAVGLSGRLVQNPSKPEYQLEVKARDADISAIRDKVLAFAGDTPFVKDLFEIIRAGKAPLIRFSSQGSDLKALADLDAIVLDAEFAQGNIIPPQTGLHLSQVTGRATLARGILKADDLTTELETAKGRNGTLTLDFTDPETVPFELDVSIDTDLERLPPLLRQFVDDPRFQTEMKHLGEVHGLAKGRLRLKHTPETFWVNVDVNQIQGVAQYDRLPYPLDIRSGGLIYDGERLRLDAVTAQMSKSRFEGLDADIGLEAPYPLQVHIAKAEADLTQLHAWLSKVPLFSARLPDLNVNSGRMQIEDSRLKGFLDQPEAYEYNVTGWIHDLDLALSGETLPGPLNILNGMFIANPNRIAFENCNVILADARFNCSGRACGDLPGLNEIQIENLDGDIGPVAGTWLFDRIGLPDSIRFCLPLLAADTVLDWVPETRLRFKSNLSITGGPLVSLDLDYQDDHTFSLTPLRIMDETSDAALNLEVREPEIAIQFKGMLAGTTLDHLLAQNRYLSGDLKGDFQARGDLTMPLNLKTSGMLQGAGLSLPIPAPGLQVDRLKLKNRDDCLFVDLAGLQWAGNDFTVSGDIDPTVFPANIELDIKAGGVDLDKLLAWQGSREGLQTTWPTGQVRFEADNVHHQGFIWTPIRGMMTLAESSDLRIVLNEAKLCDIDLPGDITIKGDQIALSFTPNSESAQVAQTLECLWSKKGLARGEFSLAGKLHASGNQSELVENLTGDIRLKAKNGRIFRFGLMAKLFSILNLLEIFKGDLPDLLGDGFAYNRIQVDGKFDKGQLRLTHAKIDGPSMEISCQGTIALTGGHEIDLIIVVSPLKTVDFVIKHLPIVNDILDGNLVSIPFKAVGPLDDPRITSISPAEAARRLTGVMERTFSLPGRLIRPILPDSDTR